MRRIDWVALAASVVPLGLLYGMAPYWSARDALILQWVYKSALICIGGALCGLLIAQSGVRSPGVLAVVIAYLSSRIGPALETSAARRFPDVLLFGAPDIVFIAVAVLSALLGLRLHRLIGGRRRPT